jgi:hypothetical protein
LAEDETQHISRARAQCHANADFMGPLRNRMCQDSIDAHSRQQQRNASKNCHQDPNDAPLGFNRFVALKLLPEGVNREPQANISTVRHF